MSLIDSAVADERLRGQKSAILMDYDHSTIQASVELTVDRLNRVSTNNVIDIAELLVSTKEAFIIVNSSMPAELEIRC
jgi:hypothetical protein